MAFTTSTERVLIKHLFSPSLGAAAEVWTGSGSCTPDYTLCPAPPDICGWWRSAPWLGVGFGHFSNRRKCTGREIKKQRQQGGKREGDIFFIYSLWYQSVHPQIFPSVLIALLYSWRLFICCRLMQPKSHYVWMDAVLFCGAWRQIWVTLQVAGVSESTPGSPATKTLTHRTLDLTVTSAIMSHPHRAELTGSEQTNNTEKRSIHTLWWYNSFRAHGEWPPVFGFFILTSFKSSVLTHQQKRFS